MAYAFDLSAAVAQIRTLELTMTSSANPTSITTSYAYGSNPAEIDNPALLPAIVHTPQGPLIPPGSDTEGAVTTASYLVAYDVTSTLLVVEALQDSYPSDEGASNLWWKPILETFLNRANKITLATAAGVTTYQLVLPTPSYGLQNYPPFDPPIRRYWGFSYTHRFLIVGG